MGHYTGGHHHRAEASTSSNRLQLRGGFVLLGFLMERIPEWARGYAVLLYLALMCLSAFLLKAAS